MKNKILSIVPTIFLATISATSCSKTMVNRNITIRGLDLVSDSDSDNVVDLCTIPITFINNDLNIPYVSMLNLPKLLRVYLGEAINSDLYSFNINNHVYTITNLFNDATLIIDFASGNFTYSDRLQFYNLYEPYYDPLMMVGSEKYGGESATVTSHIHTQGNAWMNSFKNYGIEPITIDNVDYIPFKIAIDMLKQTYETNFVYNGDKIYQISHVLPDDQQERIISEFQSGWCINQNDKNFLTFSYNELCFYLSQHHGLRKNDRKGRKHNISDYREFCENFVYPGDSEPISEQFTKSSKDFNIACCKLFGTGIADAGHTVYLKMYIDGEDINRSSYYAPCNKKDYDKCEQARIDSGIIYEINSSNDVKEYALRKYQYFKINGDPTNIPSEADTLFYTFDEFGYDQVSDSAEILEIVKNNSNIQNIVYDVAENGGGYVFTLPFLISALNGSCTLCVKDPLTNERSKTVYSVDFSNLSRDDLTDKNRYILTSPISFSCGNALPCLAKKGGTKIIGQTSGGGCCTVAYGLSCLGGTFANSSNQMLCYRYWDSKWENVENGAELDIEISDTNSDGSFYDELCDRSNIVANIIN